MIVYDWVDCSKEEFYRNYSVGPYRRLPIYPEGTECQGILFFIHEPPKPIGYKYQKGINPRQVFICNDPKLVQELLQGNGRNSKKEP